MEPRAVMQQFQELTAGASHLTRRHVILLAHFFRVSREAMVRRLEELTLAKSGAWDRFQSHGGITDEQERQVLGNSGAIDADWGDATAPPRYASTKWRPRHGRKTGSPPQSVHG